MSVVGVEGSPLPVFHPSSVQSSSRDESTKGEFGFTTMVSVSGVSRSFVDVP